MLSLNHEETIVIRQPVELRPERQTWCGIDTKVMKYGLHWTIHNFQRIAGKGRSVNSPHFQLGNGNELEAYIVLFPQGDVNTNDDYVSVFLQFACIQDTTTRAKLKFALYVEGPSRGQTEFNVKEMVIEQASLCPGLGWGFQKFGHRATLGKMLHGSVTIICEISLATPKPDCGEPKKLGPDSKLLNDFGALFENGKFTDITIVVEGNRLRAHKAVLYARSPVFAAMLDADMTEQATNCIYIDDIVLEVVKELLAFMYTSKVAELKVLAEELLMAADKYAVEDLRDLCADYLGKNLTLENAARIFVLADLHSAKQLRSIAIDFITVNRSQVIATPTWNQMKRAHALAFLEALVEY